MSRQVKFSEEDNYRSVDPLAVLALLAGMFSTLAIIFTPIFVVFGIVGIILGLSSVGRIVKADSNLSGFWAASIGVGLSVLIAASYFTYSFARSNSICDLARQKAEAWISMIQDGKYREAHQLTKGFFERQLPGVNLEKLYDRSVSFLDDQGNFDPAKLQREEFDMQAMQVSGSPYDRLKTFYSNESLKALKEPGKNCKWNFVRVAGNVRDGNLKDYVQLEYSVEFEKEGKPVKNLLTIRMLRECFPDPYGVQWSVDEAL